MLGLSARLCVTTATVGRRGRLFKMVRLRVGTADSGAGAESSWVLVLGDDGCEHGDEGSSVRRARTLAFFADGAGER